MWGKTFKSFNALTLAAADYTTNFPEKENRQFQVASSAVLVNRGHRSSLFATQKIEGRYIILRVAVIDKPNIKTLTDSLLDMFDAADNNLYKLIVTDTATRDWYAYVKVVGHVVTETIHYITMLAPDGIWLANAATTATLWELDAATPATYEATFTPGGTHPVRPVITATFVNARTSDEIAYKRFITLYNQTDRNFANYPVNITGTVLDTDALTTAKMQADEDDIEIYVDGKKVERWLYDVDTVNTKIWINLDIPRRSEMILEGALGVGALTEINFEATAASKNALERMTKKGQILIESEVLEYTDVHPVTYKVTGITRAAQGTTAATHADALTARLLPHVIVMKIGNASATLSQTDKRKPIISGSSTNTSWIYDDLFAAFLPDDPDEPNKRTGAWEPNLRNSTGGESRFYTGDHATIANPAVVMGMEALGYKQGGQSRSEKFNIQWQLYQPAGVTVVAMDGETYRIGDDWGDAILQIRNSGESSDWTDTTVGPAPTPASASTWTAWSDSQTLAFTAKLLRVRLKGTLAAVASVTNKWQGENATLTLDSAGAPSVSLGAEQSTATKRNFTLTNETTDESFQVTHALKTGESIEIDCLNKTIKHTGNDPNIFGALTLPAGDEWMTLVVGANALVYEEAGADEIDIQLTWVERDGGF